MLKCDSHGGMKQFIDFMYSPGLYPLIKRTSRITITSATLIHNMFTSELERKYKTYKNKLTGTRTLTVFLKGKEMILLVPGKN